MPAGTSSTAFTGSPDEIRSAIESYVTQYSPEVTREEVGIVAETVRDLASRGVPVGEALDAAEWPFPKDALEHAVRRTYEQLPRSQKRLPLI